VTHLRALFGPRHYVGVELEGNQALLERVHVRRRAARAITVSLRVATCLAS
jgi:hypothetical protein